MAALSALGAAVGGSLGANSQWVQRAGLVAGVRAVLACSSSGCDDAVQTGGASFGEKSAAMPEVEAATASSTSLRSPLTSASAATLSTNAIDLLMPAITSGKEKNTTVLLATLEAIVWWETLSGTQLSEATAKAYVLLGVCPAIRMSQLAIISYPVAFRVSRTTAHPPSLSTRTRRLADGASNKVAATAAPFVAALQVVARTFTSSSETATALATLGVPATLCAVLEEATAVGGDGSGTVRNFLRRI